jgi:hypothetical protein
MPELALTKACGLAKSKLKKMPSKILVSYLLAKIKMPLIKK